MAAEYTDRHYGETVIVCGSAPCLLEEYKVVKEARPDSKVIAVNEAVAGVWADFLVSYHVEKFNYFKSISLNPDIKSHTGKGYKNEDEERQIDYRWPEIWIGATSAGDAIQIAKKMGFSEIIMVGCPMNGGDGYFRDTSYGGLCPRFGNPKTMLGDNSNMIANHKRSLKRLKDEFNLDIVRSFSGYSAEVFGRWGADD